MNFRMILRGVISVALLLLGVGGCGGSSTRGAGGESGVSLSTIDQLPKATSPVVDSSATLKLKSATTGINLGSIGEDTFNTDSSVAACEATMRFKESIAEAAQGDLILCYAQAVFAENQSEAEAAGVDMYDGNYHVFALEFGGMEGGPSSVKMKIVKDSDGNITEFEMFACGDLGSDANEQSEYLHQTIGSDGTFKTFSMTSKGFFGGGDGGMGSHSVEVTGTLNSDNQFTSKTIETAYIWRGDGQGNTWSGSSTVVQGSDSVTFDGFEGGGWSFDGNTGTYSNRAYAMAQLIDPNVTGEDYNLQLLAIGDGAAKAIMSGSFGGDTWGDTVVEGWNGDNTQVDSTAAADYITVVQDQTPVEVGTVSISFGTGEIYDCDETPEATVTVPTSLDEDECAHLSLGHEWVNCWDVTGQND